MNARRWVIGVALLLLVGVGASSAVAADSATPETSARPTPIGPGDVYLALGDSVAAGVGRSVPEWGGTPPSSPAISTG